MRIGGIKGRFEARERGLFALLDPEKLRKENQREKKEKEKKREQNLSQRNIIS